MPTLAEMLMGYLPQGASPVFGTTTPQEQAMVPPTGLDQAVGGAINSMATLPQRAIQNSQFALNTGVYDPSVPLEAAMTTMGASPFGSGATGSAVFGAGPIKAYHGSPHDFDAFDLSKIGTGEGAQAYGHGLYFAEHEPVAKQYRDTLTKGFNQNLPTQGYYVGRDPIDTYGTGLHELNDQFRKIGAGGEGNIDQKTILNSIDAQLVPYQSGRMKGPLAPVNQKKWEDARKFVESNPDITWRPKPFEGHMYEVNINADPAHFLDWDKPLSEQSPKVQEVLKSKMGPNWDEFKSASASTAVKNGLIAPSAEGTAANLAGIPGIKYLDQGSRTAGQGSSNYVVFNDKLIDILRKYGLAGVPAAGALSPAYGPKQPDPTIQALMEGS